MAVKAKLRMKPVKGLNGLRVFIKHWNKKFILVHNLGKEFDGLKNLTIAKLAAWYSSITSSEIQSWCLLSDRNYDDILGFDVRSSGIKY